MSYNHCILILNLRNLKLFKVFIRQEFLEKTTRMPKSNRQRFSSARRFSPYPSIEEIREIERREREEERPWIRPLAFKPPSDSDFQDQSVKE